MESSTIPFSLPATIFFISPFLGALIGWLTNLIAIKMLFRPRKPIGWGFFRIQGLFPRRRAVLAREMGILVNQELFSAREVTDRLQQLASKEETVQAMAERIERVILQRLPSFLPRLAQMFQPELISGMQGALKDELRVFILELSKELSIKLENNLKVSEIVETRINAFSEERLEVFLLKIMKREFRFIEILGAILGFLIGCIQLVFAIFTL